MNAAPKSGWQATEAHNAAVDAYYTHVEQCEVCTDKKHCATGADLADALIPASWCGPHEEERRMGAIGSDFRGD
jgi:hypothetical protein